LGRLPPVVRLLGIGWYFAHCIVAGIIGGVLLDELLGWKPALTLLGLFLGLAAAFFGGYFLLLEELGLRQRRKDD
jgi:hypothetical protein